MKLRHKATVVVGLAAVVSAGAAAPAEAWIGRTTTTSSTTTNCKWIDDTHKQCTDTQKTWSIVTVQNLEAQGYSCSSAWVTTSLGQRRLLFTCARTYIVVVDPGQVLR